MHAPTPERRAPARLPRFATFTVLAASVLAVTEARGQAPIQSLRVSNVVGVYAGNSWSSSQANQSITSALVLEETFKRGTQTIANARSEARKTLSGFTLNLDATSNGRGARCGSASGSSGLPAPQRYALTIVAARPQTATIVVRYRGRVRGGASAGASIMSNVGNHTLIADGSVRTWTQRGFPLRGLPNSILLDVDAQCGAASTASVSWSIEVTIQADTRCQTSFGSASCTAAGSLSAYVRGIDASGKVAVHLETRTPMLAPPTIATLLVSSSGTTIGNLAKFFSPSCTLFATTPIVVETAPVPFGRRLHDIRIPLSIRGSIYLPKPLLPRNRQHGSPRVHQHDARRLPLKEPTSRPPGGFLPKHPCPAPKRRLGHVSPKAPVAQLDRAHASGA